MRGEEGEQKRIYLKWLGEEGGGGGGEMMSFIILVWYHDRHILGRGQSFET